MFGQSSETFFDSSAMSDFLFDSINSAVAFNIFQGHSHILKVFLRFAEKKLTHNQKSVLIFVRKQKEGTMTFNKLAEKVHKNLKMPISTAKYTIRSLRDLLLMHTGTKDNPRAPISLTLAGRFVADFLIKKIGSGCVEK